MKVGKIIGRVALGALALSVVPYQFKKDEETGSIEVRSLLWALKKTPHGEGEDKDHYTFAIPPSGINYTTFPGGACRSPRRSACRRITPNRQAMQTL